MSPELGKPRTTAVVRDYLSGFYCGAIDHGQILGYCALG